MWYLDYASKRHPPEKLLDFFIIPLDKVPLKETLDTLRLTVRFVCEPVTESQEEAISAGEAFIRFNVDWWIGLGLYTLNAPVSGDLGVKVTKDDIGKELSVSGSFQCGWTEPWIANPPIPGVYDLKIWPSLYDGREKPHPAYVGSGPCYVGIAAAGYMVSRDAIKKTVVPIKEELLQMVNRRVEAMKSTLGFPDPRYLDNIFPSIVAAGEPFSGTHRLYNAGGPGKIELKMTADAVSQTLPFTASQDQVISFQESLSMPWDDLKRNYFTKLFAHPPVPIKVTSITYEGYDYKPIGFPVLTDEKAFSILVDAGFPMPVLGDINAPESAKPGDIIRAIFPVTNQGYRGDVGVRVSMPGFERDIMQRIDRDVTIMPSLETEMPVAESIIISVTPIHLGRNKETILGTQKLVEISPMNCLLHWDKFVTVRGGYKELNPVSGFVAGKNLRIAGLDASVGTGGPPFMPYGGYILSGNLGPGDIATIEYDELYYFKMDMDKEIATAKFGALIERTTKTYEYSQIPTPSMTLHSLKSVGILLTKPAPRLEVR